MTVSSNDYWSRRTEHLAVQLLLSILGLSFVVPRLCVRFLKPHTHGWDDFLMVVNLV
ncbi:hypothetical protein BKA67DRAFT_563139 [Truncatella angustata]|uniref:Uncharacterized protein n=1 Tax=Truncatella angustata TaxID=152316 RepID=A0A9P8ZX65_9PEZI|nr:uncharacterized protein BKA67DRAFT_563139 [Truncatella angustata]KAH6653778.1 hypothetical protein BKA67DRAFT_563139 [Truncatella angustata]